MFWISHIGWGESDGVDGLGDRQIEGEKVGLFSGIWISYGIE